MPVLTLIKKRFEEEKPLDGVKLGEMIRLSGGGM